MNFNSILRRAGRRVVAFVTAMLIVTQVPATATYRTRPTPSDKAQIEQQICRGTQSKGSCRVCPAYTSSDGDTFGDGAAVGPYNFGSFVSPGANEAYVQLSGCEPHVNNWVGAVLLRKVKTKWKFIRYDAGTQLVDCIPFVYESGADLLVCRGGWSGQGVSIGAGDATYIGPNKSSQNVLINTTDSSGACYRRFDVVNITNVTRRVKSTSQYLDVSVSEQHGTRPEGDDACAEPTVGRAVNHMLTFNFDGKVFTPDSKSTKTIACLSDETASEALPTPYCPPVK
jgi:hypothetical protein